MRTASRAAELFERGVRDVQLRIKRSDAADRESFAKLLEVEIAAATRVAREHGARLWVNDYWRVAIQHGAYGAHLGQEDLEQLRLSGELSELVAHASTFRLGISTHCISELAIAAGVRPSYVALGPVFGTTSKDVPFGPRGTAMVRQWRGLVPRDTPLIAIGGISLENAASVIEAGACSIAVISALPGDSDLELERALEAWDALPWRA